MLYWSKKVIKTDLPRNLWNILFNLGRNCPLNSFRWVNDCHPLNIGEEPFCGWFYDRCNRWDSFRSPGDVIARNIFGSCGWHSIIIHSFREFTTGDWYQTDIIYDFDRLLGKMVLIGIVKEQGTWMDVKTEIQFSWHYTCWLHLPQHMWITGRGNLACIKHCSRFPFNIGWYLNPRFYSCLSCKSWNGVITAEERPYWAGNIDSSIRTIKCVLIVCTHCHFGRNCMPKKQIRLCWESTETTLSEARRAVYWIGILDFCCQDSTGNANINGII